MDFRDANHSKQDDSEPAEDIECDDEDEVEYAVDDSPMQASLRLSDTLLIYGPDRAAQAAARPSNLAICSLSKQKFIWHPWRA